MEARLNRSRATPPHIFTKHRVVRWPRACAFAALLTVAAVPCYFTQQNQQPATPGQARQTLLVPEANRVPDANDQMELRNQKAKQASYEAANAERKRQLAEDSAALLKLAAQLKDELDKTSKDTLSLSVVRKADEIERLAHAVQVKMKLTVNAAN